MKKIALLFSLVMLLAPQLFAQTNNSTEPTDPQLDQKVKIFYFHYARRCATCMAIEKVSEEAVKENFGDKVIFDEFDMDETYGMAIAKKLNVSGQTLLIIKGDKSVDLTNDAFLYARSKPDKLKMLIKEKVEELNKA